MDEKVDLSPITGGWQDSGLVGSLRDTYLALQDRRRALGLQNPGTVDNIAREVQKDVFLTNSMFSGLRGDITKAFSMSPMFHVSHGFAMGSQALAPYTFATLYGTPKVCKRSLTRCTTTVSRNSTPWIPIASFLALTKSFPGLPPRQHRL